MCGIIQLVFIGNERPRSGGKRFSGRGLSLLYETREGMNMNEVLLPCPHCGGAASIKTKYPENVQRSGMIYAVCEICGAQGKMYFIKTRAKAEREEEVRARAARAWNLRYNSGSSETVSPATETEQA